MEILIVLSAFNHTSQLSTLMACFLASDDSTSNFYIGHLSPSVSATMLQIGWPRTVSTTGSGLV